MTTKPILVHSIETFGTHDGPGIRMVVFLQGCPFRCMYCHNPDTLARRTPTTQEFSAEDIVKLLEKERPYFGKSGGVTFSGGEPTMQAEQLIPVVRLAKKKGFHVALDTNGAYANTTVQKLYDLTDLVILDVKHIDPIHHRKLTAADNGTVLANASYREQTGKPMWLRYVLVPGFTDQTEYLHAWGKYFSGWKSVERVEILPYHTLGVHKYASLQLPYRLEGVAPPSPQEVKHAADIFSQYFPNVVIA